MSLYGCALGWMDRLAGRGQGPREMALVEALEARVLMDASFPEITDLADPENTVVRFKTTLGEIDFELYDSSGPGGASAAPITVENFLNYVNSGRYFESFFHRSVTIDSTDPDIDGDAFVLQGGGFIFNDEDGLSRVDVDEGIENEANEDRSNVERSIAMALVTTVGTDTATSQFFINLRDNNGSLGAGDIDLDAQDFTVFGRVANDRSWQVVQAIAGLETFVFADILVDDNGDPVLDSFGRTQFLDNPDADVVSFALSDVPVRTAPAPIPPQEIRSTALEERFLVTVTSALEIKPADSEKFYTFFVGYPEGYANDTSVTYVELSSNTSGSPPSFYQVVRRYENGSRDQVLASGTLDAGRNIRVPVSDPGVTDQPQARKFTPFAIEVHSTEGMSANLTHSDFGASLSESFVNYADLDSRGTDAFNTWEFGGISTTRGDTDNVEFRESYLVWQALTGDAGTVTLLVYTDASTFNVISYPLEGHRRGGVEMHSLFGFATDGVQAIRVQADVPIIAAMSTYDTILNADASATRSINAYGTLGVVGGGATQGVLAGVRYSADPSDESYISFFNSRPVGTVVQLTISDSDGNEASTAVVLAPRDLGVYDLKRLLIDFGGVFTSDEFITIRYTSPQPVAAHYTATIGDETMSTAFQTQLSDLLVLSGGFDGGEGAETISLYNPYGESAGVTLNFSFQIYFLDRNVFLQFGGLPMLEPGERIDVSVRDYADVLATIQLGEEYERYTIVIAGFAVPTGGGVSNGSGQFAVSLSRVGQDGAIDGNSATISTGTFGAGTIRDLSDEFFETGPGTMA